MSLRTFLARLRGPWVSPDPNPQHSHPSASTYPTRADVRDAIDRVTDQLNITSVHPAIKARITDEVAGLWESPRREREADQVPTAWSAAHDDLGTGDLAYGEQGDVPTLRDVYTGLPKCPEPWDYRPNDGTYGPTGKHERPGGAR